MKGNRHSAEHISSHCFVVVPQIDEHRFFIADMEIILKPVVYFNRVALEYLRMGDFALKWRRRFFWDNYDLFLILRRRCIFLRLQVFRLV